MTPGFSIRPATIGDAPEVHRVVRAAWAARCDPRSSGNRLTLDEVAAALRHPHGGGFVATPATSRGPGRIVGTVSWYHAAAGPGTPQTVEIAKLAVDPATFGSGIGPALVTACEDAARTVGAARVLLAVSSYSPALVPWYESLGYTVEPTAVYSHASPTSPPPFVLTKHLG